MNPENVASSLPRGCRRGQTVETSEFFPFSPFKKWSTPRNSPGGNPFEMGIFRASQLLINTEQVILRVTKPELSENPPQGKFEKARNTKTLERATIIQVRESNLAEATLVE